jgi:hypothetical protein
MSDSNPRANLYLYEYGEAHDDLRPAFFIDERAYSDTGLAESVVESAEAAMTRAGVIYEVEVTSAPHVTRPVGVPTWEEFKQRHFVEGVPLPVRARRTEQARPSSWQDMVGAVEEAHRTFRSDLLRLVTDALPEHDVVVSADRGPSRRSPGSVDWSEERFGFEITLSVSIGDLLPTIALDRITVLLEQRGWQLTRRTDNIVGGLRELFEVLVDARPLRVTVLGQSPLYSSPAEPGVPYLIEPR